jgi:hypothetical protein
MVADDGFSGQHAQFDQAVFAEITAPLSAQGA